jgi:hypothetical protein
VEHRSSIAPVTIGTNLIQIIRISLHWLASHALQAIQPLIFPADCQKRAAFFAARTGFGQMQAGGMEPKFVRTYLLRLERFFNAPNTPESGHRNRSFLTALRD